MTNKKTELNFTIHRQTPKTATDLCKMSLFLQYCMLILSSTTYHITLKKSFFKYRISSKQKHLQTELSLQQKTKQKQWFQSCRPLPTLKILEGLFFMIFCDMTRHTQNFGRWQKGNRLTQRRSRRHCSLSTTWCFVTLHSIVTVLTSTFIP